MKPAYEKLVPPSGQSFRCFNRENLAAASRWHRHPEIELTYVENGTGTRIVGDNISSYGNHDLVLIGPDLPHTWHSDQFAHSPLDRHPAVVVQFRQDFLGAEFLEVPELSGLREMIKKSSRGLKFDAETSIRVGQALTQLLHSRPAVMLVQLLNCLIDLAESSSGSPLASVGFSSPPGDSMQNRTEEICAFISQNYRNPDLTHQMLADQVHMNPSAFSRFFRNSTGKTAMNYISEMRVSLACRLLADTEKTIAEIFQFAGFSNTSNFNRQFHRIQKMTPREYRKRHRAAARDANPVPELQESFLEC